MKPNTTDNRQIQSIPATGREPLVSAWLETDRLTHPTFGLSVKTALTQLDETDRSVIV
jgi:hypothetical protein